MHSVCHGNNGGWGNGAVIEIGTRRDDGIKAGALDVIFDVGPT